MKRYILICLVSLFAISGISAQITVSGILDSSLSMTAGAGDAPNFSLGVEEYANIRFQARLRERGAVYGAVNLIAAAGDYAAAMAAADPSGFVGDENYIAGIELERLYFRLSGEHTDLDIGLFRLPFGYGQMWGSSDFINPRNPLKPDARPRGILGAAFSWYPVGDLKVLGFGAAPRNPFSHGADGWLMGLSGENHWDKLSVQGLYSYELAAEGSKHGIHRAGLSVKADVEVGLVMDALYTYNHEAAAQQTAGTNWDGLSFSAGADYSFFDGNLIVMAEYLYNGASSSTALGFGGSFTNEHYLCTGLTWRFNDFTNISAALISGLSDISFTPLVTLNHELFQGGTLTVSAQVPMDRDLFGNNGKRGELGPIRPDTNAGSYFNFSARLRIRF